jgi:hypothetical protein
LLSSSADGSERRVQTHRLAVTRAEAARALGVSINSFERHVHPELDFADGNELQLAAPHDLERLVDLAVRNQHSAGGVCEHLLAGHNADALEDYWNICLKRRQAIPPQRVASPEQ